MRPYLRVANVFEDRIDTTDVLEMNFTPEEFERYELHPGDILLNEGQSRELVGRPAIYRGEVPGACFQNTLVRYLCSAAVAPEFALLVFKYYLHSGRFQTIAKWTTSIAHLGADRFAGLEFPLPPLNEQRRIVARLEELSARTRAARTALEALPPLLDRFRQSVLAAAFRGDLTADWRARNPNACDSSGLASSLLLAHTVAGGHKQGNAAAPSEGVHDLSPDLFPACWTLLDLRDVVCPDRPITYGILKPGPEIADGVPYLRVADFPDDVLNLRTIRKTSREIDQAYRRSRLQCGDLLLSIRGTVGRIIAIPEVLDGTNITQDSARLSLQPCLNPDFILWFLRSPVCQHRMSRATKGVAVRGINIGDVRALQVPIPGRPEQDEIVCRIQGLLSFVSVVERLCAVTRAGTDAISSSLLAKAFRGELVPQDPDDEPASVLLERIRKERQAAGGGGQRKRGRQAK